MNRPVKELQNTLYDVLIVGGGINGAALANLAAFNGLKAALLEKGDFGSGTSSKSSKLLHGGLRYLENFEFGLVKEALRERAIQLRSAPRFARPLGFIVPVYKDSPRPLWMVKLGIKIYDWLSGKFLIRPCRALTAAEIVKMSPGLRRDGLLGGVLYFDAQVDDRGLCVANAASAQYQGAHVVDHLKVKSFWRENGKTVGVVAVDLLHPDRPVFSVRAKQVVVAAGPWTNGIMRTDNRDSPVKVRTTKGAHLVYDHIFSEHALLLQAKGDGRIFFVIPWQGRTLIGTTDTDYTGDPDAVEADQDDINYLTGELGRFFPDFKWDPAKMTESFAGLRPLVSQSGRPSGVSRKHVIERSFSGVIYVIGGKYTTYRKIAEDALRAFVPGKLADTSKIYPLFPENVPRKDSAAPER
jgi:glycerol-3-phosphate dehydrogenase